MVKTSLGIDLNVTPVLHNHDAHANISDDTVAELNKMSLENKKLREMLTLVSNNYILPNHVIQSLQDHDFLTSNSNKRKLKEHDECDNNKTMDRHHPGSSKRPEYNGVTRVYKWADPCDKSLVAKDGYKWIKYGQKVTKDNPTPRGYFKCSFAPSCPVKKKVQRSVDDANLLVVIYEGEHNHNFPLHGGNFDELVAKIAISLRRNADFIEELVKAMSSKK